MKYDFGGKVSKFDPNAPVPIMYGMHYPGIVLVFGMPYNDTSTKPPCYRVGNDPRVGYNTAVWVESEDDPRITDTFAPGDS